GELGRPLLEEGRYGLSRSPAMDRHDLLPILVLDRGLLGGNLERRPHALLGQPDAPGRPGRDLLGCLQRPLHEAIVLQDLRHESDPLGLVAEVLEEDRKSTRLNSTLAYLVCRLLLEKKNKKFDSC